MVKKKVRYWCRDCREWFEFYSDVPIGEAVPGHTWGHGEVLRHITQEDEDEERAEQEICSACGVPHGDNPYTGC